MNESSELALFIGRLHPLLVHLPIGLLVLLAFMEGLSRWRRFEHANANAGLVLALAVPGSIAAAVCGWLLSAAGGYNDRLLELHFWTGIATAGAITLAALFFVANQKTFYRLTLFASFGVLIVASHFGGSLTHGSDYLFRYAPGPIRSWFRGESKQPVLPQLPEAQESTSLPAADPPAFTAVVHPIFENYCISCHGPEKSKGDLRLDTHEALTQGGSSGPAIVAGKSAESELVKRILLPLDSDDHMPPDGKPQPSADEVALLRWWIDSGASKDLPVAQLKTTPRIAGILSKKLGTIETKAPVPTPLPAEVTPVLDRSEAVAKAQALSTELGVPITALSEAESWLQANTSIAGREFKDEHLAKLSSIAPNLRWLDLAGTAITDAGLSNVAAMPNLTRLYLQRTDISDAGLKAIENLAELEYLNLYGSRISDAGLDTLANLPKLKQVYLWQTQVTKSNAMAFADSRIDQEQLKAWETEIETLKKRIKDAHVAVHLGVDPLPAPQSSSGPINSLCPVSGRPVDKQRTSKYEDHLVAFCCADCKGTFDKDPKPYLARLDLGSKPTTAEQKPINSECPVSGKSVDPARTLVHEGKLVAFCCDDCKASFEKDPTAYLAKLPKASSPANKAAVNSVCPVSGEAVDSAQTVDHDGKTVAFCCADCKAAFLKDPGPYLAKLSAKVSEQTKKD